MCLSVTAEAINIPHQNMWPPVDSVGCQSLISSAQGCWRYTAASDTAFQALCHQFPCSQPFARQSRQYHTAVSLPVFSNCCVHTQGSEQAHLEANNVVFVSCHLTGYGLQRHNVKAQSHPVSFRYAGAGLGLLQCDFVITSGLTNAWLCPLPLGCWLHVMDVASWCSCSLLISIV